MLPSSAYWKILKLFIPASSSSAARNSPRKSSAATGCPMKKRGWQKSRVVCRKTTFPKYWIRSRKTWPSRSAAPSSFSFHRARSGGCASIPGIAELVEERLGVPTIVANPFANMAVSSRVSTQALSNDAPALMVCCGLALRSFE